MCELTGMEVSQRLPLRRSFGRRPKGPSWALRETGARTDRLSAGVHPETEQVIRTYAQGPGFEVTIAPLGDDGRTQIPSAGTLTGVGVLVVQQPNLFGVIEDVAPLAEAAHAAGALLVVSENPTTLGILAGPGALGADIAVGDAAGAGKRRRLRRAPRPDTWPPRAAYIRQMPGPPGGPHDR